MAADVSWTRLVAAAGVLAVIWAVCAVLLVVIVATEPAGVAWHMYLPGLAIALAVLVGLVVSLRLRWVWRMAFVPSVPVPRWAWLAVAVGTVGAVVLSLVGPVSTATAVAVGVTVAGTIYVVAVLGGNGLRRRSSWPAWVAVTVAGLVVTVVGIGTVVEGASLLTVVFFLALVLFGFHVGFVLPMTLRDAVRMRQVPDVDDWPAVDVLIPAYNEAGVVGDCIEAVLAMDYPDELVSVVVIDDGSTDGTAAEAAAYRDAGVRVLSRDNGGKHAALNLGLACTESPVVVTVDADSRPAPDALGQTVAVLGADERVGALSAAVLPANDGGVLGTLQRLEYAVSNTNRRAYSAFAAVPVVPGCFGAYRREALSAVWGYDPDTVTEDFDVTVQLLRAGWTVRHGPATVWTIAPDRWRGLWRQRLRWYRGGLEVIRKHWDVLASPEYGYLHGLTLPARTVSQLVSPVASYVILAAVVVGLVADGGRYLVVLLGLFFVLTVLIAAYSVVLEDEPWQTLAGAPLLFVGYKHVIDASVAVGSASALVGDLGRWERPSRTVS